MLFFFQVDFTAKPTYWRPLYPPVKMKLGELLVSLTYLPAKNTLTIGVLKARNLKAKDINGKSGKLLSVSRPLAVKIASKGQSIWDTYVSFI